MATAVVVDRPDDLGPVLREIRLADDVTQVDLAEMAGVGRQWLNSFEMGQKPSAPLDMVMRVVAVLDAQVTLTRPAPPVSVTDEEPVDLDVILSEYDS